MTKRIYDSEVVKERLIELRKNRGLTQKQVAEAIHFSVSTIKQYENGYRVPEKVNLQVLAEFYGVFPDYILGTRSHKNRSEEMFHLWDEQYDAERRNTEMQFIESAEKLGFFLQNEYTSEEYDSFINYNKAYEERKKGLKTRKEIEVVTGAISNQIIEDFETGKITIQAVTEADVEKGFQHLVKRGIISE